MKPNWKRREAHALAKDAHLQAVLEERSDTLYMLPRQKRKMCKQIAFKQRNRNKDAPRKTLTTIRRELLGAP